ncbi:unnamed protein product [Paramecium primaurelia]|uniref:Uncharacterized protein n=1 Tax=Paramecium primaurelia TaxID=5886 RepID=A0A8S1LZN6_PARPR|nr:unnamed protein product [Paramecium primaurelia]
MISDLRCQNVGHENEKIHGVCTDPDCQQKRPFCIGCKFELHSTHTTQLRKFDDLNNWINENNTITKNLQKLLEQLNEIVYSIKKSIETTQQCHNFNFTQMNYATLDNTINNLIKSWKSQNEIYYLVEKMIQSSITQTTIQSINACLNNQPNRLFNTLTKQPENQQNYRQFIIQNNNQPQTSQIPQQNQLLIQNNMKNPCIQNQDKNNIQQFKQDGSKLIINFNNQKEGQAQKIQLNTIQKQNPINNQFPNRFQ